MENGLGKGKISHIGIYYSSQMRDNDSRTKMVKWRWTETSLGEVM